MRTKTFSKLMLAAGLFAFTATALHAQVGINNTGTTPNTSAILDLQTGNTGVNKGFLPQAVALTASNVAAPVTGAATGLIVYNTATAGTSPNNVVPGYYYWNGTAWLGIGAPTMGAGIDNYVARWTPNGNTLGIGAIQDNGTSTSVDTVPFPGYALFANASPVTGNEDGILGLSNQAGYVGLVGFGLGYHGAGVLGEATDGYGIYGISGNIGVYADADTTGVQAFGDTAIAAYGNYSGIHATGSTIGAEVNSPLYGIYGGGNQAGAILFDAGSDEGVLADSSGGYGVGGSGYNEGGYFIDPTGDASWLADNNNETGVSAYGFADGGLFYSYSYDAGTSSYDLENYVYLAENGNEAGGYFQDGAGDYAYIAYAGDAIMGSGAKSTLVKDDDNQMRVLYCNESPEVMFEDYGEGKLVNGSAHISLDPLFAKHVAISEKHPLRVYIQLEGDCNGVFVDNKSVSGFDVKELQHGASSAAFQWHIICNRANEPGQYHNYADKRFPVGPGPLAPKNHGLAKQLPSKKSMVSATGSHSNMKKHVNPINLKGPASTQSQGKN